jgi:hypothetical protein
MVTRTCKYPLQSATALTADAAAHGVLQEVQVKRIITLVVVLALTGCTTCREHKVACTAAAVFAAGAIAAASQHSDNSHPPTPRPISCGAGAC